MRINHLDTIITSGEFQATAKPFDPSHDDTEWGIDLADNELGHGFLTAATLEGIRIRFTDFIDAAMEDLAESQIEMYADYDFGEY